jgi:hypothetical protein
MAVSLTEYLVEIQELTKKNFEILKALNDSFYTKSEHLRVNIDNTNYVIPSFISLENKLNTLEDNFENLVNAPKTGDAVFSFDGNTQSIEVKGFTNVPNKAFERVNLDSIVKNMNRFSYKKNEVFKDFLTPIPYVKIDLSQIPDDIQQVNVKKLVVKNEQLLALLKQEANWQTASDTTEETICSHIKYSDVVKKLYGFEDTIDYVVYDKVYQMPIRYELGNGKYIIKQIKNNWTDSDFNEHYELVLDNLSYYIADETIERSLYEGDYLVTNNDKVKLLIENIYASTNTIQVKVENGGFVDLCTELDGNVDLSTLKFFAIGNVQNSKYLDIPLEEDRFVLVFLAPIQRNSLVQSPWGEGLFFDVYSLTDQDGVKYKDFYDKFVTNIGDKLFGIVSMTENNFINLTEKDFNSITQVKPVIDTENIKVTLINKHMSNSETISEIYNLYKQKEDYKIELSSVQKQIDEINTLLSTLSFEDTTTSRTIYTDQLTDLNTRKKDITASIANCIQQITIASTDTDTPVENPKYHIRGFFDYNKFLKDNGLTDFDIIKIDVQYRYKNANKATGNAETIGKIEGSSESNPDGTAIYSDWNIMQSFTSERHPVYNAGVYKFEYDGDTSTKNVPSFNQFDIPISQGETVDVRLRVVYAIGYPFVKTTSNWSDVVNIEFPIELRKNVSVLDIIEENNSDTTKEAFRGYLEKYGVIEHVSDNLVDQNITYFHQPEHIASGFYTEERRVIPLRDKLQSITNDVLTLRDEVFGLSSTNLEITLTDGESEITVNPNADNTYILKDYSSSDKTSTAKTTDFVETVLTLNIKNNSTTNSLKLFSMFPGNPAYEVDYNTRSKFDAKDYIKYNETRKPGVIADYYGICSPIYLDGKTDKIDPSDTNFILQRQNQWIYFRINNAFNGEELYEFFDRDKYLSKDNSGNVNKKPVWDLDKNGDGIIGDASAYEVPIYDNEKLCDEVFMSKKLAGNFYYKGAAHYDDGSPYPSFINARNQTMIDPTIGIPLTYQEPVINGSGVVTGGTGPVLTSGEGVEFLYGMCVYPRISNLEDICISSADNNNMYKLLLPGESLQIPICVKFKLTQNKSEVIKTICFDIRNSLYSDPLNFKVSLKAKYSNNLSNNTRMIKNVRYNPVIVN